jgi:hypothetical protein
MNKSTPLTTEQYTDLMKLIDYVVDSERNHYLETVDSHESEAAQNHIYTVAKRVSAVFNPEPKLFNHTFEITFSVENTDPDGSATAEELIAVLEAKLNQFKANPQSIIEAAGVSFNTYEVE